MIERPSSVDNAANETEGCAGAVEVKRRMMLALKVVDELLDAEIEIKFR